jgi:rSAM/selenodomain-associated transferase 2
VARLSFIIPVRNEAGSIASLLRFLRRRFPGSELLVVDGGSEDRTVAEALPGADSLLISPPGRARQMNLGAAAARGEYLLFLHADTWPEFSLEEIQQGMERGLHWGFARVRLSGAHPLLRVVEWAMNQRSRLTRVATGDQVLLVSRDLFSVIGGFADIPLMEDVEICKRLRRRAGPTILRGGVCTSSRRWEERGFLRTVLLMWTLRSLYVLGVSPHRLWRWYYG